MARTGELWGVPPEVWSAVGTVVAAAVTIVLGGVAIAALRQNARAARAAERSAASSERAAEAAARAATAAEAQIDVQFAAEFVRLPRGDFIQVRLVEAARVFLHSVTITALRYRDLAASLHTVELMELRPVEGRTLPDLLHRGESFSFQATLDPVLDTDRGFVGLVVVEYSFAEDSPRLSRDARLNLAGSSGR